MTNEASERPGDTPEAILLGRGRALQNEEQVLPLLRTIALSAGEMHGQILRSIRQRRRHHQGDPAGGMKAGLAKLQAQRLVSAYEAEQLSHIIDAVTSDRDLDVVAREVRDIHWRLVDEYAGPIALAISNMTAGSTSYARDRPVQVKSEGNGDVHGGTSSDDLYGMILGAEVGAEAGSLIGGFSAGPGGIIAGGLLGGIFGAIIGGGIGSSG